MPTRYKEFVIRGPRGWTLGFIHGSLHAAHGQVEILDAEAEGFECEGLREKLREFLHLGSEVLHLLIPEVMEADVRAAIKFAGSGKRRVTLLHVQPIESARFSFKFAVYSREHAERIRKYFRILPAGVRLAADADIQESVDPEAKGIEAYAPVHEYELKARGTVEGPVDGIVALYRTCRDEELIDATSPELVRAKPPEPE